MNKTYQLVTDKIVDIMKRGVIPWKLPYKEVAPRNLITDKPYRGINRWMLGGYPSPYFVTYKQCVSLGGHIKKGEASNIAIFWKIFENIDDKGKKKNVPFLSYYRVFNVSQCEGMIHSRLKDDHPVLDIDTTFNKDMCGKIIRDYILNDGPTMERHGSGCYYQPDEDIVCMPDYDSFYKQEDYYASLFHELVHSTGHKKRLDRPLAYLQMNRESYSKEELIAEIGASMLCADVNIDHTESGASYVSSWMKVISDDPTLIVSASSKAEKAVNYIKQIKDPVCT